MSGFDAIATELKCMLVRRKMEQKELAAKIGATGAYVSEVLNGRKNITLRTLFLFAYALDCDVRFELVPKPIPGKNYTLPDDLNADGTVKYKPLPNELNADGTIKRGAWK